jgi:hypothetical protein
VSLYHYHRQALRRCPGARPGVVAAKLATRHFYFIFPSPHKFPLHPCASRDQDFKFSLPTPFSINFRTAQCDGEQEWINKSSSSFCRASKFVCFTPASTRSNHLANKMQPIQRGSKLLPPSFEKPTTLTLSRFSGSCISSHPTMQLRFDSKRLSRPSAWFPSTGRPCLKTRSPPSGRSSSNLPWKSKES